MLYLCRFKPLRNHLRGFLMAARAGSKITEFLLSGNIIPFFVDPAFFAPRMCGEKQSFAQVVVQVVGSPPRMRGTDIGHSRTRQKLRITPACAGKRPARPGYAHNRRDHPRMCGEKYIKVGDAAVALGSPPHVRGKGVKHRDGRVRVGITPACAGKSHTGRFPARSAWDHPRMCGEKNLVFSVNSKKVGSPPHVRGKGAKITARRRSIGITPACAGKSDHGLFVRTLAGDHPRMCGEKKCG